MKWYQYNKDIKSIIKMKLNIKKINEEKNKWYSLM